MIVAYSKREFYGVRQVSNKTMVGHTTAVQLIQCYNMRVLDKFLTKTIKTQL